MMQLFLEQGMQQHEILSFFTGPAFLAWHRMGNLKSFGGPLPLGYLNFAKDLTTRILQRAAQLGMNPVLPGFSGHVPDQFEILFPPPDYHFARLGQWFGFPSKFSGLLFADPDTQLYGKLGRRFVEIQKEMFGGSFGLSSTHYYAVDQFNENNPSSGDESYLSRCSQAQFNALRAGDEGAVWVLQGWMFVHSAQFWTSGRVQAYLDPLPRDGVLILDLISEAAPAYTQTNSYYGKPFIWSVLHNFGGGTGMRGNLETVMKRPYQALQMQGSTMTGIGLLMEAIDQNAVMYELALDHVWFDQPRDLQHWLRKWVRARYGYSSDRSGGSQDVLVANEEVERAWILLSTSCYNVMDPGQGNGFWGVSKSVIEKRPSLETRTVITSGFQESTVQYDACVLVTAWGIISDRAQQLSAANDREHGAPSFLNGSAFELDWIDLTRQVLANHAQTLYSKFVKSAADKDKDHSRVVGAAVSKKFLQLLDDLDDLLSSTEYFSLDAWLGSEEQWNKMIAGNPASASASGPVNEAAMDGMAYNAFNLLTLWGPDGQISDYSSRLWGGLIKGYYKQRWQIFFAKVLESRGGKPELSEEIKRFERLWQKHKRTSTDAVVTRPFALSLALSIYSRYREIVRESCGHVR